VMMAEPLEKAIEAARQAGGGRVIYLSPQGARMDQGKVMSLAAEPALTLLCGRYEGIDERLVSKSVDEELSVGDYVLSGGEIGAMALIDACVRLRPGVMGKEASGEDESFSAGLLEYPHYTRPAVWEGRPIPEVLLSGDHGKIEGWRRAEAERLTRERRPDLWAAYQAGRDLKKPPKG